MQQRRWPGQPGSPIFALGRPLTEDTAMAATIAQRLAELGIELPSPAAPAANYVPARLSGNLLVISGQLPMEGGSLRYKGKLGGGVSLEDGQAAARLCAINILVQIKAAY